MSFENFNNNVIKSASSASSGAKKKDEETKAPSGGFSNFSKAMGLETKPVVANKPVEKIEQPKLNEAGKKAFYDNPYGTSRLKSSSAEAVKARNTDKYGLPKATLSMPTGKSVAYKEPESKDNILTKIAKAVLPKSVEDFFGLNPTKSYTNTKNAYENAYATTDLKNFQKKIDPVTGKLPKQTGRDVFKETPVDKYAPFVSSIRDITESVQIYQSAKRLESGDNTPVDDFRLAKFKAESERDKTFMAKVAGIVTELPSFAGELALTGGIYNVVKIGTEKAIVKTLATTAEKSMARKTVERILAKSAANIAGGTAQTLPAGIGRISAGTIQNMTPEYQYTKDEQGQFEAFVSKEGDNVWLAAGKAFSDQWVETVSEHSGGIFNEALSPLAKPLKNQLIKVGLFKALLKKNPSLTSSKFMKLVDSAGWDGIFAEMGEERVGEAMRGLLTQVGLSEDGFKFPTKEQLAVELVSFSIPGVMVGLSNKMLQGGEEGSFKDNTIKEVDNAGNTIERDEAGDVIRVTDQSGDIIDGEAKTHDIATEAEQIIGARDIATVGKNNFDLGNDYFEQLQSKLEDYQSAMSQTVLDLNGRINDVEKSVANIDVIEYPDGKFASKITANTPKYGISTDFLQEKLYDNKEDAVRNAEDSLIAWAKSTLEDTTATPEDIDILNNIIENTKKSDKTADVSNEKELEYGSEEKRLAEQKDRKEKVAEEITKPRVEKAISKKTNNNQDGWTATALNTIWTKNTNSPKNGYINIYALNDNGENNGTFRVGINEKMVKNTDGTDRLFSSLQDAVDYVDQIGNTETKDYADQLAEMTKAGQYGSLFLATEITKKNIRDTTTGKPAPSGVLLGERKLYINRAMLNKDIEILKSDDTIAIQEADLQEHARKYNENNTDLAQRYLESIISFEENHIKKGTVGEAYSLFTGEGATETAKSMDIRAIKDERIKELSKMTFYHGTTQDFDNFSMDRLGENTGWDNAKFGIFFSDAKDIAYNFANDNRAAGDSNDVIVKEVKLDLKNPIDLTLQGILNNGDQAPTVVKLLGGDDMTEEEAMELLDETIDLGTVSEMYDGLYGDINNKKIMQDAGYDGIISQFGDGILEYVVFDVNQIKSNAIDNTGGSNIIKPYDNIKQKRVSDASPIPAREDRGGSEESSSEVSRYDRATMLVESGNGLSTDKTNGLTKKDRQLINEQVESLLELKDYSLSQDDYTLADRELMAAYSGAGGKESVGGEGAGLLNEYYTPQIVVDKMWQIAENLMPNAETAFEPSAGIGKIINSSPANISVDGAEISKVSGTIASILNPDSNITIGDFQELFFDKTTNKAKTPPQYDIVIGNPPFGDRAGFLKGKGEEPKINRMEEYFIKRGLDMTKEGGYLIYVVNSSFLKTGKTAGKTAISELGTLVEAFRLPENSFDDTSIGTDIVVFRKNTLGMANLNLAPITEDRYFNAYPFQVLGDIKSRTNRFGKKEEYVTGNLDEAMSRIRVAKKTEEQNAPIPYEQYRLTGENSIMEGKSWEEARITPKQEAKVEAKPVTKKGLVAKSVTRKADSQTTIPKKNAAKLVIPVQDISNKKKVNPKEVEMLKRIERDMSITNPTKEETNFLNYENGKYYPDVIYYSGSIYDKIDYLKANKKTVIDTIGEDKYNKQLAGLEAVKPERVALKDIAFDPLDRHVAGLKTSFERYGNVVEGTILNGFVNYIKTGRVALSPRVSSYDVARYVMGEQASKDTKPIMGLIKSDAKRLFNHYLKSELDQKVQKEIEDKYNKEKNSYVRPDYSKIPVAVNDMAKDFRGREFKMSQTQKEGVGFLVNKGSGAIAYGVGVGKTHTLAIATKANMDKGWTKRPLFTVPKSTISKTWIATLHEMFPTLVINNLEGLQAPIVRKLKKERGENPKDWIRDGEFTIISHEGLLRLGFNEEELRASAGDLKDALWQEPTTKRAGEKTKDKYDEILGNAQKYVTDIMLSDLGFDHVSVDEVHNFRKIFQGAKPENVDEDGKSVGKKRFGNVIGGTPSKRAQQLFLITQYIQKNYNNRNVFLASATPFENHATEVYNILSLVARDRMQQMGILNINDFFSTFANFEVELDRKLNGEWLNREKMKSFANLQALQSLIKEFIDYQEDQTLVRPDRRVITPTLQMSEKQISNLSRIQDLLNGVSTDSETDGLTKGEVEDGAFLKASTYSIANSVSPYFIKEYVGQAPSIEKLVEESPKIKYTLEAIKTLKADSKTKDFGSFVFFGKMGVEYHPALAEYFAKYLGYKKSEVAYLSGKVTDDQKENIKEKFNNGDIKVLLGGDQTKEGIDLQNNGYATFNLALGWNPTQIQQVEGRVWRQGNARNIAPLVYPLVENSGDAMIYNKFEEKGGRINDLFSYAGTMFDVGEIDPAEKKLSLLTDPQDKARMQIEIDKVALYNERVMTDNDLKDLAKIQTDINDATGNIKYYKEEVASEYNSDERKSIYKKELKRYTEKLARLNEKLGARKITSLDDAIAKYQTEIDNIDLKIKSINDTFPAVLEKFTKEYQEQVKLRKTMSEHMDEIKGLIAETKERTPEEIDALRNQKIAELEAKRLELPENIAYQGGGTNASIGMYRDGTPIELGSLDSIRPVEMPELVRLARELTGMTPKVKTKLNNKLGLFKPKTGEIYLKADQFVQGNEAQLAKLLSHEIGHVTDWLPDKTMARGNLLGRIFSLKKFLSSTFSKETGEALDTDSIRTQAFKEILAETQTKYGDYLTQKSIREKLKPAIKARYNRLIDETGAIRNSLIKGELQELSEYWRPYDVENSSANFIQYRNSPAELYADAVSVLLNSPGTLEKMAPTFYTEFFDALDSKPEVKASFFELQELLNGSSEEIFKARKESIRTGFVKAEAIQADFAAKKKMSNKSYFHRIRQQLDDINQPITKKQRAAEANGAVINEQDSPKFLLQEESFIDNENFLLINDIDTNVVKPIENAGMIIDDLGEYLLLRRIQNDRADIANPYGFNKENSTAQLEFLKTTVGEENFALLEEKAQYFHDLIFKSVEEAVIVGSYNKETFETKIKPNKDTYASFQVVDYMQDYIPATIKAQVGTLLEVSNPFTATILKTVALNRLNAHQRAKNGTIKLLTENFPEDITESKTTTSKDGTMSKFKVENDPNRMTVLVDGKLKGYDVDPYIALSFKYDKVGDLNALVSLLDKFNNKLFKPLVTTYNLGFAAAFNPIRDFKRNYKSIPNATVFNLLTSYVKSLPSAVRYSKGHLDEFTRSLVESKAINAPINDYNFDPREDELGRILQRYGLIKADEPITNRGTKILRKTLLKPVVTVLEGVRFISNTFEIVSKVAGAKIRIAGGESGKQLAYNLRNYTGTPNYKVKGLQTNTTNAIFVFSNIMKEGLKSDYQIATNPKTRSGYWWKTVKVDVLPKLLMFLAGAGLLGDLLKEFFDDVSEYDKTNYIIIPLGWYNIDDKDFSMLQEGDTDVVGRKAVYMRIPHDETGRLISSSFWKMANMIKDGGNANDLEGIFALGAGQLPSVTPALTVADGWRQYLSGKNPYDDFRGRAVIDDTTFAAGGMPALKKMVQWSTNSLGLTKFATFDKSKQSGIETALQVTPFFSSVVKISNYGQQEKLKDVGKEAKQEAAKKSLADRELIAKYVKQAREDKSTLFAATKYRNDLIAESLGGRMPQNAEEAKVADALMTKFKRSLKRGLNDDPRVDTIISAVSNAEKKAIIEEIKADMNDSEFATFRQGLLEDKIVTPELMYSIK